MGIVGLGAEGGHVEDGTQMSVAGLGDARFLSTRVPERKCLGSRPANLIHCGARSPWGSRLISPRIDGLGVGNALDRDEQGVSIGPLLMDLDESHRLADQEGDALVQLGEALIEILQDGLGRVLVKVRGMKLVLGGSSVVGEGADAAGQGPQRQLCIRRALLPGERHVFGVLGKCFGIDLVGFAVLAQDLGKIVGRLGIDDHDAQTGIKPGDGEFQGIGAGGFQTGGQNPFLRAHINPCVQVCHCLCQCRAAHDVSPGRVG